MTRKKCRILCYLQKLSPKDILLSSCSETFDKINKKISMSKSFFDKFARCALGCNVFSSEFSEIFQNRMLPRYLGGLLLNFTCYCNPTNIYLFKVSNKNTRKRCEICSTLKIKAPERRHRWRCGVFIVNYEHISLVKFDFYC